MLGFYDDIGNPYSATDPIRTFHDGFRGSSHEELIYIRNFDASKYYTDIVLQPELVGAYADLGEWGTTGWAIKTMYGSRQPTEDEWDALEPSEAIALPDIGTTEAADTFTNHPVWVRVYCPGREAAQIRKNMQLKLQYFEKQVGS